jgi:protein-disulfide isomerase
MIRLMGLVIALLALSGCVFDGGDDVGDDPPPACTPGADSEGCAITGNEAATANPTSTAAEVTPVAGGTLSLEGVEQDGLVLGSPDAPLELVLYEDFQCPFCGQFALDVLPQVVENYVVDGRIRIRFHPIAAIGRESTWAAIAGLCAADDDKFWQLAEVLFANQGGENRGSFAKSNLKAFADLAGVNHATFDPCLDEDRYLDQVESSTQQAIDSGITSVPAFTVGDRVVIGFQNYLIVSGQIDSQLGE